jgi:hypothetical protein
VRWNIAQMLRDRAERRVVEALSSLDLDAEVSVEVNLWHYGLDVMRTAGMSSGRFYPAIERLESRGDVIGTWEDGPYPRRRMYRLSPIADVIELPRRSSDG